LLEGDQWMHTSAQELRKIGFPVVLDNGPSMFPEGYPMAHCAFYLGWYSEQVSGALAQPGFHFVPGAIAVHIHSFSASTVRDPKKQWVAPLLEAGAAATLGNVYEPYLSLTPHLDLFTERLRLGLTFAESAYASQRALSWMSTFVGDPLYRPFPQPRPATAGPGQEAAEWETFRKDSDKWRQDPKASTTALQADARQLKSGVIWEGLGLLQLSSDQRAPALASFQEARKAYTAPPDILRCAIHEVIQLNSIGKAEEALALARQMAADHPDSPALSVLKLLVPAAFPPPRRPSRLRRTANTIPSQVDSVRSARIAMWTAVA
jgi:hypothetical protein